MTRLGGILIFLLAGFGFAAMANDMAPVFRQRLEEKYQAAQARYRKEPSNVEAAWQMGRACSDLADIVSRDSERAALAEEGIRACRQALAHDPKSAFAHYYLGIAFGELAMARGLGALPLLSQMEDEWKTAAQLDEHIDYAGPDRCLGLLFRDAPAWPWSVGSRPKAIQYLSQAVRLSPKYPDNQLALAEAYLKWNEYASARIVAAAIPEVFRQARKDLVGPAWESIWLDWAQRWKVIQARLNEARGIQTPRTAR